MAPHDRGSTNQAWKAGLEFYLRLFEKAERDLKKKAQPEATQAVQSNSGDFLPLSPPEVAEPADGHSFYSPHARY